MHSEPGQLSDGNVDPQSTQRKGLMSDLCILYTLSIDCQLQRRVATQGNAPQLFELTVAPSTSQPPDVFMYQAGTPDPMIDAAARRISANKMLLP